MPELVFADFQSMAETLRLDDGIVRGVALSGMSQAGKSTTSNAIRDAFLRIDPNANVFAFPNSNGFRGVARAILDLEGIGDEDCFDQMYASGLVGAYKNRFLSTGVLLNFYEHPKSDKELRANAVNKLVASVGDNDELNIKINEASSLYLGRLVKDSDYADRLGMQQPNVVLMDGRSMKYEGYQKFLDNGILNLFNCIVTCDERAAIGRIPNPGTDSAEVRVANLQRRNAADRKRAVNPTSMPQDFERALPIEDHLRLYYRTRLFEIAALAAQDPQGRPLTIATDNLRPFMIEGRIDDIVRGALIGSTQLARVHA